jgi:uncharacterized protein YbjT (DUF2867 family)
MIAVVGATGNTGRAVVKELKQLGHDPIIQIRRLRCWARTLRRPWLN